jgi:DNA-binding NarL/FixJ family response regulator
LEARVQYYYVASVMVEKNRLMLMVESISKSSTGVLADLTSEAAMKVLHVDGDLNHLKVAEQCLKMQGRFRVDNARSAEEAIEKMKKETYDAIISDYQMPGKNGLEFLKELREKGNDTPFIIFTGKEREEIAVKALNLGAAGYFNRHGEPETVYGELAHGIRQAIKRKKADLRLHQKTADLDKSCKLVQVCPPTGVQHKRWGWDLNPAPSGDVSRTFPLFCGFYG